MSVEWNVIQAIWHSEVLTVDNGNGASGESSIICLLYTSPSPRDLSTSRMPSSA